MNNAPFETSSKVPPAAATRLQPWLRWSLLLLSCGLLGACGSQNLCKAEAGGFQSHPDWQEFVQSSTKESDGWQACMQMAWQQEGTYQGTQTVPVRITPEGALGGRDDITISPFGELKLPANPDAYKYRFRVFVFPKSGPDRRETCRNEMKQPDFDCLSHQGCWFYYELRPQASSFSGETVAIEGNDGLSCKTYLRPAP